MSDSRPPAGNTRWPRPKIIRNETQRSDRESRIRAGLARGDTLRSMAAEEGITPSVMSRWIKGNMPDVTLRMGAPKRKTS